MAEALSVVVFVPRTEAWYLHRVLERLPHMLAGAGVGDRPISVTITRNTGPGIDEWAGVDASTRLCARLMAQERPWQRYEFPERWREDDWEEHQLQEGHQRWWPGKPLPAWLEEVRRETRAWLDGLTTQSRKWRSPTPSPT
jgi:hypothetical protein